MNDGSDVDSMTVEDAIRTAAELTCSTARAASAPTPKRGSSGADPLGVHLAHSSAQNAADLSHEALSHRVRELFETADVDGSGFVDMSEACQILQSLFGSSPNGVAGDARQVEDVRLSRCLLCSALNVPCHAHRAYAKQADCGLEQSRSRSWNTLMWMGTADSVMTNTLLLRTMFYAEGVLLLLNDWQQVHKMLRLQKPIAGVGRSVDFCFAPRPHLGFKVVPVLPQGGSSHGHLPACSLAASLVAWWHVPPQAQARRLFRVSDAKEIPAFPFFAVRDVATSILSSLPFGPSYVNTNVGPFGRMSDVKPL